MNLNTVFSDYWELLNNFEDYLKGGYRSHHTPAPEVEFKTSAPVVEHKPVFTPQEITQEPQVAEEGSSFSDRVKSCRECDLHLARNGAIPGWGNDSPHVIIVLPPPGYDEDDQGVPITADGAAFLEKWLGAVGLTKDQVYITNIIKCRTPGTRPPFLKELNKCRGFLLEQIKDMKPKAVLFLGELALSAQTGEISSIENHRGKPFFLGNTFSLVTYEPASVLRDPTLKRPVWEDLKVLRDFLTHA